MNIRTLAIALLTLIGLLALPVPAQAETSDYFYLGQAGGSRVKAVGATVSSDETMPTSLGGSQVPAERSNTLASSDVGSLLSTGTVDTAVDVVEAGDGVHLTSTVRTQGVSLLNGAITADAVETTGLATFNSATNTASTNTEFVNLHIVGVDVPADISSNETFRIPGVAAIRLNGSMVSETADGVGTLGWGMVIKLLDTFQGYEAGTVIHLNQILAMVTPPEASEGPPLGGVAFSSRVISKSDDGVKLESGPTVRLGMPRSGNDGETDVKSTAGVHIAGLLDSGAAESTATGTQTATTGDATMTNEIVGLDILSGQITADVIKVESRSQEVDGAYQGELTPTFVNLKVGSVEVPADVAPNTVIDVGGLGRVVVNHQLERANSNAIRALRIKLDTRTAGLPVGSVIEVAVAATKVG